MKRESLLTEPFLLSDPIVHSERSVTFQSDPNNKRLRKLGIKMAGESNLKTYVHGPLTQPGALDTYLEENGFRFGVQLTQNDVHRFEQGVQVSCQVMLFDLRRNSVVTKLIQLGNILLQGI